MKQLVALIILLSSSSLFGQNFLDGYQLFSKKKEAYFTLNDNSEVVGFIDDIDRKKGLIEEIRIKTSDGKKVTYKSNEIKSMFVAPSGFDKFSSSYNKMYDATQWNKDKSVHDQYVKEGYVYFENTDVLIKNTKINLLLQLVNPGNASKIKVYFDPYAKETTSASVGGIKVAGGIAKSYYIKKGNGTAYKLTKSDYKKKWSTLFGECKSMLAEYTTRKDWKHFEEHIAYYDTKCE